MKVAVVLLAGGIGKRMACDQPKQFLAIQNKPMVLYSYEVFQQIPQIEEIVIVCDPVYRMIFPESNKKLTFALPGHLRQDSMTNGFLAMKTVPDLVCIHDAARPFINEKMVHNVLNQAIENGAATLAVPIKFTVKQGDSQSFVHKTLDRNLLWEVQTPQVISRQLLFEAIEKVRLTQTVVTDDVSMVELLGAPVKLVEGCSTNIKITHPEDLAFAEYLTSTKLLPQSSQR